jgi:hypothetical protein
MRQMDGATVYFDIRFSAAGNSNSAGLERRVIDVGARPIENGRPRGFCHPTRALIHYRSSN